MKKSELNLHKTCQKFVEKLGDVDPLEMEDDLVRYALVAKENKQNLKAARDFLNCIYIRLLMEVYTNLFTAVRMLLARPFSIAAA